MIIIIHGLVSTQWAYKRTDRQCAWWKLVVVELVKNFFLPPSAPFTPDLELYQLYQFYVTGYCLSYIRHARNQELPLLTSLF